MMAPEARKAGAGGEEMARARDAKGRFREVEAGEELVREIIEGLFNPPPSDIHKVGFYHEEEVKEMTNYTELDKRAQIVGRCIVCGYQMIHDEVWLSDNKKDNRTYCYCHAPDDAIRLKDTIRR